MVWLFPQPVAPKAMMQLLYLRTPSELRQSKVLAPRPFGHAVEDRAADEVVHCRLPCLKACPMSLKIS